MTEVEIHRCETCGGPCLTFKGTVHGWTCRKCLAAYVQAGAQRSGAVGRRGAGSGPTAAATDTRKPTA